MPAAATSRREFPQRDILALYTEIYDNLSARQARRIDVAVRLLSESGTEVFVGPRRACERRGAAPKKPWEIYGYSKQIPLKDIAPGRYAASRRSAGAR